MIHISELASYRVEEVEDVVRVGDRVFAKCIGVDDKKRVKMSRKAALEEKGEPQTEPTYEIGERKPRRDDDRGGRGGGRGGDRRGGGGGRGRRD
jgi:polyribonucleotide nucleotidyltransferase